jgi:hypothetical protein
MDTSMHHDPQAFCTVTQMARKLGLSRPRFYQLAAIGIFPPPAYCLLTRMPIYPQRLQEVCLTVRKTGIGFNGQSVRFYDRRKAKKPDPEHKEATLFLRKMGLPVTIAEVRMALRRLKLPRKGEKPTDPQIIIALFEYFRGEQQPT